MRILSLNLSETGMLLTFPFLGERAHFVHAFKTVNNDKHRINKYLQKILVNLRGNSILLRYCNSLDQQESNIEKLELSKQFDLAYKPYYVCSMS